MKGFKVVDWSSGFCLLGRPLWHSTGICLFPLFLKEVKVSIGIQSRYSLLCVYACAFCCVWLSVTRGLQPTRLLCPWDFPGKNTGVGWHFLLQGIFSRSPTLQADSLPAEPPGKPKNTGVGSLSLLQGIFPTQRSNPGLPHCRQTTVGATKEETISELHQRTHMFLLKTMWGVPVYWCIIIFQNQLYSLCRG